MILENKKKTVLFLTGTRADYGKIKSLMQEMQNFSDYQYKIFATGMHTLEKYGQTVNEIRKDGFDDIYVYVNQIINEPMDLVLANTVHGLARYVHDTPPDLMIIHGDRVEALAGAIVGSLRNILTAHIEGGELSGTIDESIRHATTKLCHIHFVANEEARNRLIQMGEDKRSVFVIGSPDIDVMLSDTLPSFDIVKKHYEIPFEDYGIAMFHPVTTEIEHMKTYAHTYVNALLESNQNYVVIYPNNDEGAVEIFEALDRLKDNPRFRCLPSLRFEYFLTLLKMARYIVGNSSAAIREAPVYGIPAVNIGTRQKNRFRHNTILDVSTEKDAILAAIYKAIEMGLQEPSHHFGKGNSSQLFKAVLETEDFWSTLRQKQFHDLSEMIQKTGVLNVA